ncbi:MAG: restriction endonuclease subunit S, partial [Gammaproteobacteria bacterium]|nr:restriction endonuclease subunit S [Gammaproteobacteria bacterium]
YSEHLLRVIADEDIMLSGCLFAFMRSETAFRMLRSISMGTKLQDHHPTFLRNLPVPYPPRPVQKEIHKLVIGACEKRQRAIELEDEAIALVESAIEQTGIIKLVKPKP